MRGGMIKEGLVETLYLGIKSNFNYIYLRMRLCYKKQRQLKILNRIS
jgi:hypothetical protein